MYYICLNKKSHNMLEVIPKRQMRFHKGIVVLHTTDSHSEAIGHIHSMVERYMSMHDGFDSKGFKAWVLQPQP